MTAMEAANTVYANRQCMLIRPKKGVEGEYDMKDAFMGKKKGWFYLDGFTASAIVKVYEAVNDTNREKLSRLPIATLASICFRMCK